MIFDHCSVVIKWFGIKGLQFCLPPSCLRANN